MVQISQLNISLDVMVIMLLGHYVQMIGYVKCFDSNKTMSFKVIDNKQLKKYNQIWKKVRNLLNIKFDSELVYGYNDKYIKTKIKMYGDKVNTNFQGKKIPKEKYSI